MLYYSGFLVVAAFISAVLGFVVLSGTGAWVPRVLFVVFMVLLVISFGRRKRSRPPAPQAAPPG
jgi:uncharacterized membrane protein YtjA (UPF0391 family)